MGTDDKTGDPNSNSKYIEVVEGVFQAYRTMLTSLFLSTFILVLLITILLLIGNHFAKSADTPTGVDLPILAFVAMAGALGAFFSALRRLYSFEELPAALMHPQLRGLRNRYLLMYSLIPPLTGIIGAVVLYVMVAGHIVAGDLFANFVCTRSDHMPCSGAFLDLLASWSPATPGDNCKCLVWGFIAGFSERLIPDAIGRLGEKVTIA